MDLVASFFWGSTRVHDLAPSKMHEYSLMRLLQYQYQYSLMRLLHEYSLMRLRVATRSSNAGSLERRAHKKKRKTGWPKRISQRSILQTSLAEAQAELDVTKDMLQAAEARAAAAVVSQKSSEARAVAAEQSQTAAESRAAATSQRLQEYSAKANATRQKLKRHRVHLQRENVFEKQLDIREAIRRLCTRSQVASLQLMGKPKLHRRDFVA